MPSNQFTPKMQDTSNRLSALSITFHDDILSLKKGTKLEFIPGLNVIVGDQGSGKSTLIGIISGSGKMFDKKKYTLELSENTLKSSVKTMFFDTEKSNPRTSSGPVETMRDIALIWSSHGESNKAILESGIRRALEEGVCLFIDEPESGLSIRNQIALINRLKEVGEKTQLFVVTHSETMIERVEKVLNLETNTWMSSKEFIHSHKKQNA